MGTFTNFQNRLPDPVTYISNAGDSNSSNAGATTGPGYASVRLSSKQPVVKDMTNSGRLLARAIAAHNWDIDISYNPMTREEFDPIFSFLIQRLGALNPFFVSLPQYLAPKNTDFAQYASAANLESAGTYLPGTTSMLIGKSGYSYTTNGTPVPGDIFNVVGADSNHNKVYMVTRVETNADYQTGTTAPTVSQVRIHFTPQLQKTVTTGDDILFDEPTFKVVQSGDVQEYSLNTNNLYSFSLKLEEVQ